MKVDLHIHTTASDGCWDPHELIGEVKRANLGLFAIADHDSVRNVDITAKLSKENGLLFIKAAEFTTKFCGKICHILGYGINPKDVGVAKTCRENTRRMTKLNVRQVEELIDKGIDIDINEFITYEFDKKRGGGTVTNFLVDKGIFKTFKESLAFVAKNTQWDSPDYPSPEDVAAVIKKSGGHAILAHPGSTLVSSGLSDKEIDKIIDMGIEGLECYTNYHDKNLTKRFLDYCTKRKLLITAGSDCHGPLLKDRVLGQPSVTIDQLNLNSILKN